MNQEAVAQRCSSVIFGHQHGPASHTDIKGSSSRCVFCQQCVAYFKCVRIQDSYKFASCASMCIKQWDSDSPIAWMKSRGFVERKCWSSRNALPRPREQRHLVHGSSSSPLRLTGSIFSVVFHQRLRECVNVVESQAFAFFCLAQ